MLSEYTVPTVYDIPQMNQCDSAWGNAILGSTATICNSGNGAIICSLASIMSANGRKVNGANATCGNINTWLKANNGYLFNNIKWGILEGLGNVQFKLTW